VHDCIPLIVPEHCSAALVEEFARWFASMALHADAVLTNSECTRADFRTQLRRLLPSLDIPAFVLPLDAADAPAPDPAPAPAAARPFVLFVGTIESRKNHLLVLNAWLGLVRKHGPEAVPDLVCVGKRGWPRPRWRCTPIPPRYGPRCGCCTTCPTPCWTRCTATASSPCTNSDQHTDHLDPGHVERVQITAPYHPLAGRLVRVVRRKRYVGTAHLVIEGPDGGRQLLPARHAEPAGTVPAAAAKPLRFTPGALRALAELVHGLRGAPSPAPEARHVLPPGPAAAPAVEHLPARDAPAVGRALERAAAPAAGNRPRVGARARKPLP
jgi:hypothetical protein